jgi:hypothetical protein
MLVRSALWAGDHALVAHTVDHGQRLGGGTVDNVHARTSIFCLMVGDAAGRVHQDSLHAALMTDLTTRFGVGKDHPPACTIRKGGLIVVELQPNQRTASYGALYRYLTSGGAYPVAWRDGIWQVVVKRAEHPLPNTAIQILVQNVPAVLSTHELAAALLAMAGYAPVTPQMGTAPADVVRFSSDPDAVVMLRMRLGRDKATNQPDGGKIVVWVNPPASDPWLRRLPAALYVPGITASPVLVLLKDDPLDRASVLTPAVHYSPRLLPATMPTGTPAAAGGGSSTVPVTTLPNGFVLPAHLDLDINTVPRASGWPPSGSASADAGTPASGAAAGVMPPAPSAPSRPAETAAPSIAAATEDGGAHVGLASATAPEVVPPEPGPCTICHEILSSGDNLVNTSCNHTFHLCCLDKWRAGHNTCPNCRSTIPALPGTLSDSPGAGGPLREGWVGVLHGLDDSDDEVVLANTLGHANADRSVGDGVTEGGAAAVLGDGPNSAGGSGAEAGPDVAAPSVPDSGVSARAASGADATASGGRIVHLADVGHMAGSASAVQPDTPMLEPQGDSDVLAAGGASRSRGMHTVGTGAMGDGAPVHSGSAVPPTAGAATPMADAGPPPTASPAGHDGGDSGGSHGPRVETPAASGRADRAGSWRASPIRDDEAVAHARAAAGRSRGGRGTSVNPLAVRSGYMLRNRSAPSQPGSWLTLPATSGRAHTGAMAMEVDVPAVMAPPPLVPSAAARQSVLSAVGRGRGEYAGTSRDPGGAQALRVPANTLYGQPILGTVATLTPPTGACAPRYGALAADVFMTPQPTVFGQPIPDRSTLRSPAVHSHTQYQLGPGVSRNTPHDGRFVANPIFYQGQSQDDDYCEDDRGPASRHHPGQSHRSYDSGEDDSLPARFGPHSMWLRPQRRAP